MNSKGKKRVTVTLKCPNPLFEEWLIAWKEQAVAKESKMQYIFSNALQSLRKYPLPFQSGRDCKILKGFGDKLCKMLDEKLKEYKKSHGTINIVDNNLHPMTAAINIDSEKNIAKNSNKQDSASRSKINGSTTKQYIPQYGSGSYAILVSLYTQSIQPNYPGFLSKAQVIEHGKDLVNTSFTKPDPGSRYTAWSSMKTLISKNLVSKTSHPPKFSLTHEGQQLAQKLYENSGENPDKNQKNNDFDIISYENLVSSEYLGEHCTSDDDKSTITKENKNANITITNNCKCYDVDIPDEFTDELLRNSWISENDIFSSDTNNDNNIDGIDLGIKGQYIKRYDASFANTNPANSNLNICPGTSKVQSVETSRQGIQYDKFLSGRSLSSKEDSSGNLSVKEVGKSTFHKFYSTDSVSSVKLVTDIPTKNIENTSKNALNRFASSSSVTSISTVSVVDNFVMASNSFDIILYVDNNETSGSSNNQNDAILVYLTRQGIKHEVKDLKVGDFLWICRDRTTKNELVLPYIVERKRMDDLAKSIKDRRYYEQKFRLKKSGVENLIYLVESHGTNQHLGLPLQNLYQAASNTAIQDNFFIKFTENAKETVEYLVNFSRILVKMFKSKILASCSKHDIQPVDINDDLISLITFKELNKSSIKNRRRNVTELFVKMLIQIKGISVERALAITQLYPTPAQLKRMFQENPGSQGEKLLSSIKYGKNGKSLGIFLSKTIYQAFNKTQY